MNYVDHIFHFRRRKTHEVRVGDVGIGGANPIRVQSMTISDTMDTAATVNEVAALAAAGCEIVRITAPSRNEAENLREIKQRLRQQGISVPLVADIHFTPNAALIAADIVEKVRINPGNYADKKRFEVKEYSDAEYAAELERIYTRFAPLVKKCKENGVAMRIGVNHGSLSDRIMNRYGDTPEGMVASALEFLQICEDLGFRDVVFSMKSSVPTVMIRAYRLLAARMNELGMTYPFHLGVTEAGDGEDGRIKSAVGIGALLEDGIGDTIRVSLTEDAIFEVPVAFALVEKYNQSPQPAPVEAVVAESVFQQRFPPFATSRLESAPVLVGGLQIGGGAPVRVIVSADPGGPGRAMALPIFGQKEKAPRPELLMCENGLPTAAGIGDVPLAHTDPAKGDIVVLEVGVFAGAVQQNERLPETIHTLASQGRPALIILHGFGPAEFSPSCLQQTLENLLQTCRDLEYWQFVLGFDFPAGQVGALGALRQGVAFLLAHRAAVPVALQYRVPRERPMWRLDAAASLGALLAEGIGDAVILRGAVSQADATRFCYNLLQATRLRITKTEFISCPSCGRTLFNLQSTTERIKRKTNHLKGVKIAIMGCIVNGPGEMADADFGYVGAGVGKVNLFVGKGCVERNIPEAEADARLIALIKKHGKWVEPNGADPGGN